LEFGSSEKNCLGGFLFTCSNNEVGNKICFA